MEKNQNHKPLHVYDYCLFVFLVITSYSFINIVNKANYGYMITILTCVFSGGLLLYTYAKKIKVSKVSYIYLLYTWILALSFSLYKQSELHVLRGLLLSLCLLYWYLCVLELRLSNSLENNLLWDIISSFRNISFKKEDMQSSLPSRKAATSIEVILAFVGGLFVLLVVFILLVSSDRTFYTFVENIGIDISLPMIIVSLTIACLLFIYIKQSQKQQTVEMKYHPLRKIKVSYVTILSSILLALYLLYLIVACIGYSNFILQSSAMQMEDVASYTVTGFMQMSFITMINLCLFIFVKHKRKDAKVKLVLTLIAFETLAMIALTLAKMMLYVDAFGLTTLRALVSIFLLALSLCCFVYTLSLYIKISATRISIVILALAYIGVSYANISEHVTMYNLQRFEDGSLKDFIVSDYYATPVESMPAVYKYVVSNPEVLEDHYYEITYYIETYAYTETNILYEDREHDLTLIEDKTYKPNNLQAKKSYQYYLKLVEVLKEYEQDK